MEAPQSSPAGSGVVVLHKGPWDTGGGKIACLKGFHKKTPVINIDAGFDNEKALDGAGGKVKGHGLFLFRHKGKVGAVVGFDGFGKLKKMVPTDPLVAIGDFFHTGHIEALALLDGLDIVRSLQKAIVGARIEPGHAPAQKFHPKLAPGEVFVINAGDFDFSPGGWLYMFGDVHDLVIVKIKARNSVVGLREGGFFFYGEHPAIGIEFHHPVGCGILDPVAEDGGSACVGNGFLEGFGKPLAKKDVVPQHEGYPLLSDKAFSYNKGIGEAPGLFLDRIVKAHAKPVATTEKFLKYGQVPGGRDDHHLSNARKHQDREGVVNHGFVIHREDLL